MRSLIKFAVDYIFPLIFYFVKNLLSISMAFVVIAGLCLILFLSHNIVGLVALLISKFEDFYCAKCLQQKPSYNCARSFLKFNQVAKKIIHKFKYHDNTEIAKIFARLICDRYSFDIHSVDYIVPVPMNRFKQIFRMYNQAEILSAQVAKILNKPFYANILLKPKWTKSQTSLSKAARKKNIKGTIKINSKYDRY